MAEAECERRLRIDGLSRRRRASSRARQHRVRPGSLAGESVRSFRSSSQVGHSSADARIQDSSSSHQQASVQDDLRLEARQMPGNCSPISDQPLAFAQCDTMARRLLSAIAMASLRRAAVQMHSQETKGDPMSKLANQVALVTGGSRGIGAAIAKRLAADGATVAITYAKDASAASAVVQ